ncbi:hypothetical protein LTR10_013402 [Elasticomyces elasticus]|uniref:Uncharacterized protein n=1 Tax=Exophiala sideris TaxID=1016849 RepID=A0ABR0J6D7_9EURO|nr:hypothetical protein LTR10_013402 [Elasticomyces elasticus]KAK5027368.1 hypothetical protein LTS07_006970 [Exophiala sideris]KAK5034930.1 hypothetical protein LTR13_006112 [Exophiala sideris]KAK5056336.1 hypothetical protein LTR69_007877 [Exophiala sideris]KAK5181175.1 hypothetical protein LTR44_006506 [Eurotiomycetes sp. CCFEE 6388]
MSNPPPKKGKVISEYFKPYIKTNVPAKRPSPSIDKAEESKSPRKGGASTSTPKTVRRTTVVKARTPNGPTLSPLSARASSVRSIPFRSPRPQEPIEPPSTYKRASLFGTDRKIDPASPAPAKSFDFADLPTSTQTVPKGHEGVVEIRDSDDDTASVDSLESLGQLLGRKKDGNTTSLSSSPDVDEDKLEAERVKTLSAFTRGRSDPLVGKDKLRALHAKQKATNFDLSSILGAHLDDHAVEQKVQQSRADYDASRAPSPRGNHSLDRKLLVAVVDAEDGEGGVSRLMDAVERTEALASDRVFLFFGADGLNDWHEKSPVLYNYPKSAIPDNLWRARDNHAQSRAFKSGYMLELATRGQISDEALSWKFDSVVLEQDDESRNAYIECLRNASSSWTRNNVTAQDVQTVFQTLGADVANFQDATPIQPKYRLVSEPARRDPKYLLTALDLFQSIAQDMDFIALSKLTSMLCRLAIDSELMSDGRVSCKVEQILEHLLSLPDHDLREHVSERMIADVGQHLQEPTLQAHLLSHILPTSSTASRVRTTLARIFFMGFKSSEDPKNLSAGENLDILTEHVATSESFMPKRHRDPRKVDYTALRAQAYILDTAIADGGRPAEFDSRAEEVAFNKSVDKLAETVRLTFTSIIDTGASHLSRTEAKAALQTLYWRLLYSVRTEVRPKKNIFDARTGMIRSDRDYQSEEKGKNVMKQFLARKEQKNALPDPEPQGQASQGASDQGANVNSSGSSDPSETEVMIRRQLGLGE